MNNKGKLKKAAIAMLMASAMCATGPSHADDSEIFFSKYDSTLKPNVLFILDTSGSMDSRPAGATTGDNKLTMLKDAVENILLDPKTQGIRIGMMEFSGVSSTLRNEIRDIDEPDPAGDKTIISQSGGNTVFQQDIVRNQDDGHENADGTINLTNMVIGNTNNLITIAYRFDNLMLKSISDPDVVAAGGVSPSNNGVNKVELNFGVTRSNTTPQAITVRLEEGPASKRLEKTRHDITSRLTSTTPFVSCNMATGAASTYRSCDVTSLIRAKIADPAWVNGNAVTFFISFPITIYQGFSFVENGIILPNLIINVDDKIVGPSTITYRHKVITETSLLVSGGNTPIVRALYDAARYISNITSKSSGSGPYHAGAFPSPLLEGCQSTHLVLMSDGSAVGGNLSSTVGTYIGSCVLSDGSSDGATSTTAAAEKCGRSLSYWMSKTDQSEFLAPKANDPNYIVTQTIRFDLAGNAAGDQFLKDLASESGGKSYAANNMAGLVDAFTSILEHVLEVNNVPMSGSVTLSAQSRFKQRREAYYTLFKSEKTNYWPGNVKGFLIKYVAYTLQSTGEESERAVLYDGDGNKPVLDEFGILLPDLPSLWSKTKKDSGVLDKGGVIEQFDTDPNLRKVFTYASPLGLIDLKSSASLSNADLDVTDDDTRKGLLNFARGYEYKKGGSTTPLSPYKIGDAARATVQLATYGCDGISNVGKDILDCPFDSLQQMAIVPSNDGFVRGYDSVTGKAIFEYMPKEMLPILKDLQAGKALNINTVRSYGLDGKVVIYHDDINNNDYIDNGEKAYAYVVSGRGGSHIYALDISQKGVPTLAWTISNTGEFAQLGNTWSVPAVGKIDISGVSTPVLVFGGGYDDSQDTIFKQNTDTKGNTIYIVNAITGKRLWLATSGNMDYSIPSSVELVENDNGFITDIFVGDMGGQLWRFIVSNGGALSVSPGGGDQGLVASISGTTEEETRRFYQKPVVYRFTDSARRDMFSVNMGTGYQAHPLTIKNADRFYSFRFPVTPVTPDPTKKVLKESDLAKVDNKTVTDESGLDHNGFMMVLTGEGEKIISGLFADFDRVVFNTYLPNPALKSGCNPVALGTQRTYYQNLKTGVSILATAYVETAVYSVPPDVTMYCGQKACTIVASPDQLSNKKAPPAIDKKATGEDKLVGDADVIPLSGNVVKVSWTDNFDAEPAP